MLILGAVILSDLRGFPSYQPPPYPLLHQSLFLLPRHDNMCICPIKATGVKRSQFQRCSISGCVLIYKIAFPIRVVCSGLSFLFIIISLKNISEKCLTIFPKPNEMALNVLFCPSLKPTNIQHIQI